MAARAGLSRRIVLFTPGHTEPGGAQRHSKLIAEGLWRAGWEVKAITRAGALSRPALRSAPGLTVVEVPGFGRRRLGALLFALAAIPLGLLWGRRARALVSVQLMSTTTAAALCGLILSRPFLALATTGGGGALGEVEYLEGTRSAPLRLWLLRRAACLLAQTEAGVGELARVGRMERVAVLPNPVERPAAAPPLPGTSSALYAGRFAEEKDLPCLLRAWREVVRGRGVARLTLLGAGGAHRSVEAELREMLDADPALRESVRMPGWAPGVEGFLRATDVFVLPSRSEGMSNALLEACAWGRVVVASDIPSNRAVLGDGYPLLFPPGDAEALAECLARALDPLDPVRGVAAGLVRERTGEFSTEAVVGDLEELIDAANSACD
ncbi:MAG TPA: glycosyltransferase family 4 protein [Solirubrobacterales bacterium]|jgi:glycosyltransferase involved in cell wall biosynthesis|nr:glycosyltransferase family 4 protein [Solirubrobacterales bacterium]